MDRCSHARSPFPAALSGCRLHAGLASLLLETLASDANALLFVRVWRTQRAEVCRHLAHLILVRPGNRQVRLPFDGNLNSFRNGEFDRVRIAERENHSLAFQLRAVAYAHDIEI